MPHKIIFYKRPIHSNLRNLYDYNHYCERTICYVARGLERENK